jgi:enoyl-CoA hydratase/carnithine racemase
MELASRSRVVLALASSEGQTTLGRESLSRLRELVRQPASMFVLKGRRGSFCEGLALEPLVDAEPADVAATLDEYAALLAELDRAPCPVVALVDGPALGGGLGLAAAADVVVATPASRFGLPEVFWGLAPAVALAYVARRAGPARARMLALGAKTLEAREALHVGLVDEVTEDLEAAAARYGERLRRASPEAVAEIKRSLTAVAEPGAYAAAAKARFARLCASELTARRLRRLVAGEIPWELEGL